ncbi:serine protease [Aquabacterium sp. A7-Y]|uniref:S1 family peptidase n=1 Tax=Aquabacterium sp. A7-Y TaxID=1349605 RepID=UPI00223E8174|nr:serine protease [Aquabacterium sp. A7-Y]MCW7537111.1 serine protease [Aquabacterium sp. A7-Y]
MKSFFGWLRRAAVYGFAGLGMAAVWAQSLPLAQPPSQGAPALPPGETATSLSAPPVSATAQRLYGVTRGQLVQVRTLLKGQASQASVGSGFVVTAEGHLITNYHVVSQVALEPGRYRLVYSTDDGREGPLQLLAFDAIHDLALVRAGDAGLQGRTPLAFRPSGRSLAKGERIYSLGNPLDVGFAVVEGNYNGLVERSFYPNIFFAGALNAGMSGGPALDEQGRVIGVNVATRRDGQLVSFLVPGRYAEELLAQGRDAKAIEGPLYDRLSEQLLAHQQRLTERFLKQPWRESTHARYAIPVPQETFMRCWGNSTPADTRGLEFERSECEMDTQIFISDWLQTGGLSVRHEAYDGSRLGSLRFAAQYSASFRNESFGGRATRHRTVPQCEERFVDRDGLALRAVLCMSAYRKLTGLYDLSVLVATLDQSTAGVQGRFDARGVDFKNAMRLAAHYLQGYGWTRSR